MPEISLQVDGQAYAGWKRARVVRSLEAISGSFELEVSDRWNGQAKPWPIAGGAKCVVLIGSTKVITGYVDRRSISYDAGQHSLTVSGRDKTGDLVDCSSLLGKWEFYNIPFLTLVTKVCDAFGIPVSVQAGLTAPPPPVKFSISPGETAFEVIDKACRLAAILAVADGQGGLILTRAGSQTSRTALIEGQNILGATADFDASGRFSRYIVTAQQPGSDTLNGATAASVKGQAIDSAIRSSRVLMIRSEKAASRAYATSRAEWEAKTRAARGDSIRVGVQGWEDSPGVLWQPNTLVRVDSPTLGVKAQMLLTQVEFGVDDQSGTTTSLTLKRPDAFLPEPVVSKVAAAGWPELAHGV